MISVEHLTRRYGPRTAVDDISFEIGRGEIVGFLGPNGAGKTTTMRILAGYLPATAGTVRVAGFDVLSDSIEVRRRIGYLPENVPLYQDMRVDEYLFYRGRLKGLGGRRLRKRVDAVLSACGLEEERHRIIGRLSKGFRQRVGLADSLVHEPDVLILDEPTIGLDPNQIRHIRNLIRSLAQQHTVLLSTHILTEVESICQRVLIINRGRIVAADATANLHGMVRRGATVVADVRAPAADVAAAFEGVPGVSQVTTSAQGEWTRATCGCEDDEAVRVAVFGLAAQRGWTLRELRAERRNLEDVFVSLTTEKE